MDSILWWLCQFISSAAGAPVEHIAESVVLRQRVAESVVALICGHTVPLVV